MHIGIDIDDVLFGWWDRAHAASERAGITNGKQPSTEWKCFTGYGCTEEEWLAALEVATLDGSLYRGAPIEGSIEPIREMYEAGHQIHMVTARGFFQHGDLIRQHTIEWLRDWEVPHHSMHFIKDKTLLRLDMAIDDGPHNVLALSRAGVDVWMMNAPHNVGTLWGKRVSTMGEFAEKVAASGLLAA